VLGALGCDAFQGSYFALPMTAAALEHHLAEDHLAEAS
jgi:EAL domain-containing protein (putative c-di-GMP-specific phosphodiesterase class I)